MLSDLRCENNKLTELDVLEFTELETLFCSNNQLTSLDVSKCDLLLTITCRYNKLSSLNTSNCIGLNIIDCSNNKLTKLNFLHCVELTKLYCYDNPLIYIEALPDVEIYYIDDKTVSTLEEIRDLIKVLNIKNISSVHLLRLAATRILYQPGGQGYERSKIHFESLARKNRLLYIKINNVDFVFGIVNDNGLPIVEQKIYDSFNRNLYKIK